MPRGKKPTAQQIKLLELRFGDRWTEWLYLKTEVVNPEDESGKKCLSKNDINDHYLVFVNKYSGAQTKIMV